MKASLNFDLDDSDDLVAFKRANKATDLTACLWNIREEISQKYKHQDLITVEEIMLETIQEIIRSNLDAKNINFDEIYL